MSKNTDEAPAEVQGIVPGEKIHVEASTRKDISARLKDLRQQAQDTGLTNVTGGCIQYNDGVYFANITFNP